MDELLAAAAEAMNVPGEMVMRSARARAAADGAAVEDVLAAWGGGAAVSPAAPAAAAPAAALAAAPTAATTEAAPDTGPVVEVIGATAEPEPDQPEAEPEREPEADEEAELVVAGAVPRWLAALFIVVPVFAIAYALFLPNGPNCGDGGRLAVDPVTGLAVNCDGSEYGVEVVDYFAIGEDEYAACAACHGDNGGGSGNFPAFTGGELLATFPEGQCSDQVEWIRLGSQGWPEATYGATAKPVGGSGAVMPAFGGALTEVELRAVTLYERVVFGGQGFDDAIEDCGLDLVEDDGGEMAAGG